MGVRIKYIRIRNYKSLKSISVNLVNNSVLIGSNNVGKTSFLQAIHLALSGNRRVSSEDIFINDGELLPKDRKAIIDVLIVPTDEENNETNTFDDVWFEHFGDLRSENPVSLDQFVAIRSTISLNSIKGEYEVKRNALIDWPSEEEVESYKRFKKNSVTDRILQAFPVFYMDAKRDIASEMREKTSYWGRMINDIGLDGDEITRIEESLNSINDHIVSGSNVLKHLVRNLSEISSTVDSESDSIKINPVSRKIRDLNRGIDITFKDKDSETFPISSHGMGTRSWTTFLTLVAYVTWKVKQMEIEEIPYHPLVLLEEPEAHLHPQAQRQIFKQMNQMLGQKIITSHSPMVVGQAEIVDIRHMAKENGYSVLNEFDTSGLNEEDMRKIKQEVFKTRGDLLFAKAMILCEGETEEQVLPTFFKEFFGYEAFELGINIISVGGKGKYKPFLRLAKNFNVKFYILSDGEIETINKVQKDLKQVFGEEASIADYNNVKYLPNKNDFENYLLSEGYFEEISMCMEQILGKDFLASYITKKNSTPKKRFKTTVKCEKCNQFIYEDLVRDYSGAEGQKEALLDCIHDNKTAYSSIIANIIIDKRSTDKIPRIINEFFTEIDKDLRISKSIGGQ